MTPTSTDGRRVTAAEFTRPLLLTPSEDLRGYLIGHLGRALLLLVTCASVLAVFLIFLFVLREAALFLFPGAEQAAATGLGGRLREWLDAFSWGRLVEFLTSRHWYPEDAANPEFGILSIICGSLYVTVGSLLVAVPLGLLAAVFLSDMAPFQLRQWCKPIIEILAAIPSVAYGFFAVVVMAPWLQRHFGFATGTNALNSSIILAVMALPTIISVAEDSLSAVGRELREASYGLGATRAETLCKVVIPAAHSGIIAAVILGMMRAIGETMVVWMASGNANQIPSPWWDISQSIRTMTATIAGEMGETVHGSAHYRALFMVGSLLLLFTFGLNLLSEHFLARVKKSMGK